MFLGSIKAPVPSFFNRLPLCKIFFACQRFFCSVEAPFSCPGHPYPEHRAQRRSRLGAPAPSLDRGEHGVTLQWLAASVPARSWFFPRSVGSRNMASGRTAPRCPERGHPEGAATKEARLPGLVPAGTCSRLGQADLVSRTIELDHSATATSPQSKSQSSFQTRCMTTASLRATATLARRMPIRLASAKPHVFSLHDRGWRLSKTFAASNK